MWGERIEEPVVDIENEEGKDGFPGEEAVEAVRAWVPQRLSGNVGEQDRCNYKHDEFHHRAFLEFSILCGREYYNSTNCV